MEFLNKILENNVIFYSIIGVLIAIFLIIIYFAFIYKKGDKVEKIEKKEKKEKEIKIDTNNDLFNIDDEVENKELEREIEKQEAKEELEKVIEQMTKDVENKKEDSIESFESLQEENAIISYQELVNNVKTEKMEFSLEDVYEEEALEEMKREQKIEEKEEKEEIEEVEELENVENNTINSFFEEEKTENKINDLFGEENINNLFEDNKIEEPETIEIEDNEFSKLLDDNEINEEKIINEVKNTEPKKYKKSEIISPIYGRQNIDASYPKIETFDRNREFKDTLINIEEDLKREPLIDEDSKNEEFLNTLKEFRRNL